MEQVIWIIYSPDLYKYDKIKFNTHILSRSNTYGCKSNANEKNLNVLKFDCVFVYYLIKELSLSLFYRNCVIQNVRIWKGPDVLLLAPTKKDLIDYNWNERIYDLVRERCEVDHALSWLSTLGGAFSALGDYFETCADTAGKISVHQLKLALRLGDPNILSRCRLYLSLSLIQKKKYKLAASIVRWEYHRTRSQVIVDERLVRMCKGAHLVCCGEIPADIIEMLKLKSGIEKCEIRLQLKEIQDKNIQDNLKQNTHSSKAVS